MFELKALSMQAAIELADGAGQARLFPAGGKLLSESSRDAIDHGHWESEYKCEQRTPYCCNRTSRYRENQQNSHVPLFGFMSLVIRLDSRIEMEP